MQTRTRSYDSLGQLLSKSDPEDGSISYDSYDVAGNLLLETRQTGAERVVHRYTYDSARRLIKEETNKPAVDSNFTIVRETLYEDTPSGTHGAGALGYPVTLKSYDGLTTPPIATQDFEYGALNGRLSKETDKFPFWVDSSSQQLGVSTQYQYDNFGRLSQLTYPNATDSTRVPTRLQYTYAHGFLTRLDSNRQGTNPGVLLPLITNISYSSAGEPSVVALANGVVENTTFDVADRPNQITVNKGSTILWDSGIYEYDGASNLTRMGAEQFTYDSIGRLASAIVVSPLYSTPTYQQLYSYDPFGNMTARTGAAGAPETQNFDVDPNTNRLRAINLPTTSLAYQYNPAGGVSLDGLHAYDYDTSNRLQSVRTADRATLLEQYDFNADDYRIRVSSGDFARQTIYIRTQSGKVLSEFARPISTREPHWRKDYIYALGRHIAIVENTEPDTPTGITSSATTTSVTLNWQAVTTPDLYGYDVYRSPASDPNNYVKLTSTPATVTTKSDSTGAPLTQYFYKIVSVDAANIESPPTAPRLIKVGDTTSPTVPGSFSAHTTGTTTAAISWSASTDSESALAGYNLYRRVGSGSWPSTPRNVALIQTLSFADTGLLYPCGHYGYRLEAIDAAGNKSPFTAEVTVMTGTEEQCGGWAQFSEPDVEHLPDGSTSPYRLIGDHPDEEVNFRLRYYHVDHLGTPRVVTDAAGNVFTKANLFPFGESVPGSEFGGGTHRFTGHERDLIDGQDYMLARSYQFNAGRFGHIDPIQTGELGDSGTWNRYTYAGNNPLAMTDPTGMFSLFGFSIGGTIGGWLGGLAGESGGTMTIYSYDTSMPIYFNTGNGLDNSTWGSYGGGVPGSTMMGDMPVHQQPIYFQSSFNDPRTEKNLHSLDPILEPIAREHLELISSWTGLQVGSQLQITSGTRTLQQQQALHNANPKGAAKAGQSKHNFGLAYDITFFTTHPRREIRDGTNWRYRIAGALGRSLGLNWGGDWKINPDWDHFELIRMTGQSPASCAIP